MGETYEREKGKVLRRDAAPWVKKGGPSHPVYECGRGKREGGRCGREPFSCSWEKKKNFWEG